MTDTPTPETTASEQPETSAEETVQDDVTPALEKETAEEETTATETEAEAEEEIDGKSKAGREAAKYRKRLREAEAQRDDLAARLEATQRKLICSVVGDALTIPGDLFEVHGATVADLLDEDGNVSADKVQATVEEAVKKRPGLKTPKWPDMGQRNKLPGSLGGAYRNWHEVL